MALFRLKSSLNSVAGHIACRATTSARLHLFISRNTHRETKKVCWFQALNSSKNRVYGTASHCRADPFGEPLLASFHLHIKATLINNNGSRLCGLPLLFLAHLSYSKNFRNLFHPVLMDISGSI